MPGAKKPKGGRGKRSFYSSHVRRIPAPVIAAVDALIDDFYQELARIEALPTAGEWWEVMGVSSDASRVDVKRAYRQMVSLYHPDVNRSPGAALRFQAVRDAYEGYLSRFAS